MEHFEEKGFWNLFNAPDPVVTFSSISSTIMSTSTDLISSSAKYHEYYANDLMPPASDLHAMTSTAAEKLNQLSPDEVREGLWIQFVTVTGLAFAASVLLVLIVALTWAAAGSKTAKYYVADSSSDDSSKTESNPMIGEETV